MGTSSRHNSPERPAGFSNYGKQTVDLRADFATLARMGDIVNLYEAVKLAQQWRAAK